MWTIIHLLIPKGWKAELTQLKLQQAQTMCHDGTGVQPRPQPEPTCNLSVPVTYGNYKATSYQLHPNIVTFLQQTFCLTEYRDKLFTADRLLADKNLVTNLSNGEYKELILQYDIIQQ